MTKAQENAAEKIVDAISEGKELLIWAVTGAGKTEMLFPGITKALEQGKRVCIATPRADVVRELLPRLQQAFSSVQIQGLFSGSRDNDGTAQLIISTTHQLYRYRRAFDVLIIDEIDAFPYHHDASLQFAADRAKKENAALIYLTATPRDRQQDLIASQKLNHVFVPIRFHGHSLPIPTMIHCTSGTKTLPPQFLSWIKNRIKRERQLLVFVPTIKLANDLKKSIAKLLFAENLIFRHSEIEHVHAEDKNREEKILNFRNKKIYTLITTTILERGVTFPSVDVAVLYAGHQVFDEAALVQISGRAGRSPQDPTGEVIFFHDGQTNAMVRAVKAIKQMNKRAEIFKKKKGESR
ncbi:DEAD/DEAH box helicase [Pseudogracilibacillus sp. SO30301A]|uniref:DEAD/DEAH box helicase n=1 Tax=Pseudogracilibacillus sp. SO30301A TaxID=3098291 RepID=UPI00300DCACC